MCKEEGKPGLGRPWRRGKIEIRLLPGAHRPKCRNFLFSDPVWSLLEPVKWRIGEMFPSQASVLLMTISWRPQHTYRNLALLLGISGL